MREAQEINNLSEIDKFSEENIIRILKDRYRQGSIYTYVGPALISINPERALSSYGETEMKKARENNEYPHVFTVAEKAWRGVKKRSNQAIILSGDSGSGKSVNANYILEYLSDRCAEQSTSKKLISASLILEIFGNASTKNNNNSSRFGKYIELFYKNDKISQASIQAFLLEKGRAPNETNNFHAVVMMKRLIQNNSMTSRRMFYKLLSSMDRIGMSKSEVLEIFRTLYLVAILTETRVVEENEEKLTVSISQISEVCKILSVTEEDIMNLLLTRRISIGPEIIIKKKTLKECTTTKNTLIRVIYEKIFSRVLELINTTINTTETGTLSEYLSETGTDKIIQEIKDSIINPERQDTLNTLSIQENISLPEDSSVIGILDIYGFEVMNTNGLDQLCINYANEKIQAEYVKRVILENRKAVEEEGIELPALETLAQTECIFEGSLGIVKLLDEESFLPSGSVEGWLQKVSSLGLVQAQGLNMSVDHYAGKVTYETDEFVERNRNAYSDVYTLLKESKVPLLLPTEEYKGKMSQTGIIGEFQNSLHNLLDKIHKYSLHYIRCIKPSVEGVFSEEHIHNQLRFSGVFETVKIFMLGFYTRLTKEEYTNRYTTDPNEIGAQVGKTYIFLTEHQYNQLELERQTKEEQASQTIKDYMLYLIYKKQLERQKIERELERERERERQKVERELEREKSIEDAKKNEIIEDRSNPQEDSIFDRFIPETTISKVPEDTSQIQCTTVNQSTIDNSEEYSEDSSCNKIIIPPEKDTLCPECSTIKERYKIQTHTLSQYVNEISILKDKLSASKRVIKEKNSLIKELSHKIEVMLYELSSGEYFSTIPATPEESKQISKSKKELFKQICALFVKNLPQGYQSYYESVCCSFTLFRVSAICRGGISENIPDAIRTFESAAHSILSISKTSVPLYLGFFLSNAIFIARTSPGESTSDMLQGVFMMGCKAISEEIVAFGMDFLFKSFNSEPASILSKLLKKPTIDSVISHLKMVHSILVSLFVPKPVIANLFEYLAKIIDLNGFDYIIRKEKKFSLKHLQCLDKSIESLSELLLEIGLHTPSTYFPYLLAFSQFVSMQREGYIGDNIFVQLGILTSSQTLAAIRALSPEVKGKNLHKIESALSHVGPPEKIARPVPLLTVPIETATDDPTLLYHALYNSPVSDNICQLLAKYNLPTNWLDQQ
ncbi:myosin V [Nematocida sp. AWRm80]|nr:myosin V [Nematocida sp. AWRm80]